MHTNTYYKLELDTVMIRSFRITQKPLFKKRTFECREFPYNMQIMDASFTMSETTFILKLLRD